MENNERHDQWVDRRLAALDPPQTWEPDATLGLARFRARQNAYRIRQTRWTWAAVAASVTAVGLFLLAPAPCSGAGCSKTGSTPPPSTVAQGSVATLPPAPPAPSRKFKESGSVLAPITVELFTDYECPHCATVFLQVIPGFVADYVKTGKVRLIHRDFPLAMHRHAKLAARYANAAGELGYYDIVVNQIFRTQALWAASGDIGTQVALVLPAGLMDKVRNLVQNDAHLDDSVAADATLGRQDQLTQTPTMVVVYKGKRQLLAPIPPPELLKSYFDELLAKF
jgi:protein-disulfide isomerase